MRILQHRHLWDPSEIMFNLMQVATADKNKPALGFIAPIIAKALELRGLNVKMVRYAIATLSQLLFEPKCLPELLKVKRRLSRSFDQFDHSQFDAETERDIA